MTRTRLLTSLPIVGALLVVPWMFSVVSGSRGVVLAALVYSLPLVVLLAGVRLGDPHNQAVVHGLGVGLRDSFRLGRVHVVHRHHDAFLAATGKEILLAGRYFCAGCYGLILGTIIGDALAVRYLSYGADHRALSALVAVLPLTFVPVLARYTVYRRMKPGSRVASNALLGIGCWLVLLCADAQFNSVVVNVVVSAVLTVVAMLRQGAAIRENAALAPRIVAFRP